MNAKSPVVPIAAFVAVQALLGWSEAAEHASVGRGWPVAVKEFAYVGGGLEGEGQQAAWDGKVRAGVTTLKEINKVTFIETSR